MDGQFLITRPGGPEVLQWHEAELGAPGAGQIRIRHTAIGVNYIDIYHRNGTYPLPLPSGIGVEAAGVIEAVGPEVSDLAVGDRVVYAGGPPGAYGTARLAPAGRAVKLPEAVPDETAAALFFKGLTAQYLLHSAYPVKPGTKVLFLAAAGGVGMIALQWLKQIGAQVIGVVSTAEKAELAKQLGAEDVIISPDSDFAAQLRKIVPQGVDVVYDSVGASSFTASLDSLRPRGTLVSFGTSSGAIPPTDLGVFGAKGSLFFTRCSVVHYMGTRPELLAGAAEVFDMIASGVIKPSHIARYALAQAQAAHTALESRKTQGSLLLIPG
jgi:NADPH2:quinone reductase